MVPARGGKPVAEDARQAQQERGDPGGALHPGGLRGQQRRFLAVFGKPPARAGRAADRPFDEGIGHGAGCLQQPAGPARVGAVLRGIEQNVKITDFGLARAADDASLTRSGGIVGTPMYMAPEQATGGPLDPRTDLFSLGSVLYTMASGRPPFRAPSPLAVLKRVAEDTPRPIRQIIPEVPQWLCDLIASVQKICPKICISRTTL